jgi:aldehyde:ferredoxin oxidoreductase
MIRKFNIECGVKPEDDHLPERFYKELLKTFDGRTFNITKDEMASMLRAYYRARGWGEDGYP